MSQRVRAGKVFSAEELTRDRGCGAQALGRARVRLVVGHSAAHSGMGRPEVGFNWGHLLQSALFQRSRGQCSLVGADDLDPL